MNIVMCSEVDYAGVGYHLSQAVNRFTDHHMTHIVGSEHRFKFPYRLIATKEYYLPIKEAIRNADFILYGHPRSSDVYKPLGIGPKDDTPYGFWHGGSSYRKNYKELDKNRPDIVFAHAGLAPLHPDNIVLQQPFNVKDYDVPTRTNKVPKIGHACYNRLDGVNINGTDKFGRACMRLKDEGYEFGADLIEDTTWKDSVERKRNCDIYFDRILQIDIPKPSKMDYGLSLVEAATFGSACISGDDIIPCITAHVWDQESLYITLKNYLDDILYIGGHGNFMRKWAEEVHDYSVIGPYFISKLEEVL